VAHENADDIVPLGTQQIGGNAAVDTAAHRKNYRSHESQWEIWFGCPGNDCLLGRSMQRWRPANSQRAKIQSADPFGRTVPDTATGPHRDSPQPVAPPIAGYIDSSYSVIIHVELLPKWR
jgi:hypothetical protein